MSPSRANMDLVVSGMGGGLKEEQLAKELRALGLKWGQLTSGQVSGLCFAGEMEGESGLGAESGRGSDAAR